MKVRRAMQKLSTAVVLAAACFAARGLAQSPGSTDPPAAVRDIAATLPATDFSIERTPSSIRAWLERGGGASGDFQSATLPFNPLAPEATAVGSKMCVACHAIERTQFAHTQHVRAFDAGAKGGPADPTCETCHGAGSAHAANPGDTGAIIRFSSRSKTPVSVQTSTCLNCHAGGAREHWLGSVHEARGLSCSDCHNPMTRASPEGLLAKRSINEVCAACHQDVRAKFNRRSHMPLPEGQMSCADCHNPHGTLTRPLLKTDTVNTTCYSCHAEKRGPFLFEHAPVRGNCLNCHDPHGSNQQTLLLMPMPMLCQQCHTMTRHPNDLQTRVGLGNGPASGADERLMGRSCLTCHTNVHGSNNPSGARYHK
jgi:DmsE family decaheme c-type cytochrome